VLYEHNTVGSEGQNGKYRSFHGGEHTASWPDGWRHAVVGARRLDTQGFASDFRASSVPASLVQILLDCMLEIGCLFDVGQHASVQIGQPVNINVAI
jgi:hypothetical protein